jgi:hypothetical protein
VQEVPVNRGFARKNNNGTTMRGTTIQQRGSNKSRLARKRFLVLASARTDHARRPRKTKTRRRLAAGSRNPAIYPNYAPVTKRSQVKSATWGQALIRQVPAVRPIVASSAARLAACTAVVAHPPIRSRIIGPAVTDLLTRDAGERCTALDSVIENPVPAGWPSHIPAGRERAHVDDVGRAVREAEVDALSLRFFRPSAGNDEKTEKQCCHTLVQGAPSVVCSIASDFVPYHRKNRWGRELSGTPPRSRYAEHQRTKSSFLSC